MSQIERSKMEGSAQIFKCQVESKLRPNLKLPTKNHGMEGYQKETTLASRFCLSKCDVMENLVEVKASAG